MRRRATAAVLLLGGVLAGCGGSGETKTVTETASGSSSAAAAPPATTETSGGSTQGASTPPPEDAPVLASRTGSVGGKEVRLELLELARSGETTALTLRLTLTGEEGSAQIADTFNDGITQESSAEDANEADVGRTELDGVYLVDGKNRKKYLVGRDENGLCACDSGLSGVFIKPDAPVVLSATFGAPPADVEAVNVFIPSFGTFKDVPLG